ncbi:protein FAM107B isoform X3 [Gadus macrocephalus]|uniref:protein FAM107B isoform X3 n=1 Tax=Gadus macrocephalus TaxID=80720 RepID=UPI0028CBAFCD|nr:protein FAM107B isoform X3 [Gadus macrocephalus]
MRFQPMSTTTIDNNYGSGSLPELRATLLPLGRKKEETVCERPAFGHNKKESHLFVTHPYSTNSDSAELSQPRKLNGSIVETPSHQDLHRELLLSHKRGLVLEEKPELKRVLEQRRLELTREEEQAQRRPSDLEKELRKRQQKLQETGRC